MVFKKRGFKPRFVKIFIYYLKITCNVDEMWKKLYGNSKNQNSAESGERSVLTLGSLCLPCCVWGTHHAVALVLDGAYEVREVLQRAADDALVLGLRGADAGELELLHAGRQRQLRRAQPCRHTHLTILCFMCFKLGWTTIQNKYLRISYMQEHFK